MSTVLPKQPTSWTKQATDLWQWGWQTNPVLMFSAVLSLILIIFTSMGLLVDPRYLVGEPIWMKPTKFAVSTLFYTATLMWILSYVEGYTRVIKGISWVTAGVLFIELGLIFVQAYRGVRSHFNIATPLDSAIFSMMGSSIAILWIVSMVAMALLGWQKFTHSAWGLALKWGLFLTIVGAGLGWLMTSPSVGQLTQMQEGVLVESGGHTVGLSDGEGGKLPLVGWSNTAGDLRIGHFIGLHAMQVLPLIGWLILQNNAQLEEKKQRGLIHLAGLGYLGVMMVVTWQALRGEALIAPGVLTLGSWFGLLLFVGIGVWWVVPRPGKITS